MSGRTISCGRFEELKAARVKAVEPRARASSATRRKAADGRDPRVAAPTAVITKHTPGVSVEVLIRPLVRLRHPMECLPFRPASRPAWSPNYRDRRDAGRSRPVERIDRSDVRLVADRKLGAVRINFRYASFQSMAAAHSEKAGRDQYFEGPHETFGFRRDEIDPTRLDLQYQPIRLEWRTSTGALHSMTLDWAIEMQDGRVVFGEDKASDDYFDDPDLNERLDFAEQFLGIRGASLERRVAGGVPTRLQRRVVKDIFDARRTGFDDNHAFRVRQAIAASGEVARLGTVIAAIGEHPALSLEIARAMMHQRLVAMPLTAPPMPDTPVTIPPAAKKGALRAFLARHVPA